MKINIILPYNTWGGAFRSTYELANRLAQNGANVQIYIPFIPYLEGFRIWTWKGLNSLIRGIVRSVVRRNVIPWFDLKVPISIVPVINNRFIRDADIVIANHWFTAKSVARLATRKGEKYNFVRDIDPWSANFALEVESLRLPIRQIALASWLKEFLVKEVGVPVEGVVPNGTNMLDFGVPRKTYNDVPVISMLYADLPAKGMPDGLAVLTRVKELHPEVRLVLFGWKRPPPLPFDAEFINRPVKEELRNLYAGADIFLWPSLQEGSGNPPREAMAAGCAVVATNVGCVPDCTIPGETALVMEPGDVEGMVSAVCVLLETPGLISSIGQRGYEHIQKYTWEDASLKLTGIFDARPHRDI